MFSLLRNEGWWSSTTPLVPRGDRFSFHRHPRFTVAITDISWSTYRNVSRRCKPELEEEKRAALRWNNIAISWCRCSPTKSAGMLPSFEVVSLGTEIHVGKGASLLCSQPCTGMEVASLYGIDAKTEFSGTHQQPLTPRLPCANPVVVLVPAPDLSTSEFFC